MIATLLFDFNNVLLFVEESAAAFVCNEYQKIEVPSSYSKYFFLNTELLTFIQKKRPQLSTAILTASEFSLYQPEIKAAVMPFFDHIFYAKDNNWSKDVPATYLAVAKKLKTKPETIFFTDDKFENVAAAKTSGMNTHHFVKNTDLFAQIEK